MPWRRADWLIVPILLLAAALRIASAGYSLWFDEFAALALAHQPLHLLWSGWMAREANPPLYYSLLGGWMWLFGSSDFTVQMLSVLIGLAGIPAAWLIARRIAGTWAGLLAAMLFAVSAAHVDFSQEVRGYILAQTGALWACLAMATYLERPRLAPLIGYAAAALVALYSHTMMAVFVGLANLAMLWLLRHDRRALGQWLAANIGVALVWAWWAWISLGQAHAGASAFGWIARPGVADALRMTGEIYLPLYVTADKVALTPLLTVALLAALAWFAARDRRPAVVLLATLTLGAPLALWAISQLAPVFLPRTLFWAFGPMIVLVAVAIAALPSPPTRVILAGLLLALELGALARWLPTRESEAWPQAVAAIAQADPHALVVVEGDAMAVAAQHYLAAYPGLRLVIVDRPAGGLDHWADGLVATPRADGAVAQAILKHEGAVFTLRRGDYNPGTVFTGMGSEQVLPGITSGRQPLLTRWRAQP